MPVGHQERQFLDLLASAAPAEPAPLEQESMRRGYLAMSSIVPPGPDVETEDRTIAGPAGDLPLRIYRPPVDGPTGVLVYFHGGGWTIGGLDTHDHPCRSLCSEAGVVVVSVGYRLAPEDPFPAALDDSWAALSWVVEHASELGGDSARLAVGGDSGGANLAAVLALMARDAGGPALALQLLVYPAVDLRADAVDRYPSLRENAEGYILTLAAIEFFLSCYRPDPATGEDWHLSPILAADHRGLPPALVITAEYDPLRDEGRAYAETLEASGVTITYSEYAGTVHCMFQLAPLFDAGAAAISEAAAALRAALS